MASHNPSGKPDMMSFPGVNFAGERRPKGSATAIKMVHLEQYSRMCCLPLSCSLIGGANFMNYTGEIACNKLPVQKECSRLNRKVRTSKSSLSIFMSCKVSCWTKMQFKYILEIGTCLNSCVFLLFICLRVQS